MKSRAVILIACACAAPAWADPMCVGSGVNIPVPGAVEVERHIADVASAHVAGLWQEGRINGLAYRVFSNRTGLVADDLIRPTWRIEVFCDTIDASCRQVVDGSRPDRAILVADGLERCLSGAPLTASDFSTRFPSQQAEVTLENVIGEPAVRAEPVAAENDPEVRDDIVLNCDSPLPTDENDVVREAQTILLQIGVNPGPADGLLGPLTVAALQESLGPRASNLSPLSALTALRDAHCPN